MRAITRVLIAPAGLNHYMTLPLANPIEANAGDAVLVGFNYRAGGSIPSLQASIVARHVGVS